MKRHADQPGMLPISRECLHGGSKIFSTKTCSQADGLPVPHMKRFSSFDVRYFLIDHYIPGSEAYKQQHFPEPFYELVNSTTVYTSGTLFALEEQFEADEASENINILVVGSKMSDKKADPRELLSALRIIIAIDFSQSNAAYSTASRWGKTLHSIGESAGQAYESPYRRALVYLLKSLPNDTKSEEVQLINFAAGIYEQIVLKGDKYQILEQGLHKYDKWVHTFETSVAEGVVDASDGTSLSPVILRGIQTIYETKCRTLLVILTDGGVSDPCREAHAVREASLHPLCISIVGVTCCPEHPKLIQNFDQLYTMDDNLFDRAFDNLNFTPFQYCSESQFFYPGITQPVYAGPALVHKQHVIDCFIARVTDEIPAQLKAITDLRYFDRDMDAFSKIFAKIDCNTQTFQSEEQGKQYIDEVEQALHVNSDY